MPTATTVAPPFTRRPSGPDEGGWMVCQTETYGVRPKEQYQKDKPFGYSPRLFPPHTKEPILDPMTDTATTAATHTTQPPRYPPRPSPSPAADWTSTGTHDRGAREAQGPSRPLAGVWVRPPTDDGSGPARPHLRPSTERPDHPDRTRFQGRPTRGGGGTGVRGMDNSLSARTR